MRALSVLRKVHAWAGLGLALLLAVQALSGALLVFKPEWLRLTQAGAAAPVVSDPAALAEAGRAAERIFGAESIGSIVFAGPEIGLHQVYLEDGGGAYLDASGALVRRWEPNGRAVDWLFDLHHHLLNGETGEKVAGAAGLLAAVLILTGLIVWAPAWRSFRWSVVPVRDKRAAWLSAHRDLGVLVAPVALALTLTGAALALPELARPAAGFLTGGATAAPKPPSPSADAFPSAVDWSAALAAAQARFPDATVRIAVWPRAPGAPVQIRLRQPAEWHANGRTAVWLAPSGAVLQVVDAQGVGADQRLLDAAWPLHAAKVGGPLWKVSAFLSGLGLAALSVWGGVAYARKLLAPPRARRGRDLRTA